MNCNNPCRFNADLTDPPQKPCDECRVKLRNNKPVKKVKTQPKPKPRPCGGCETLSDDRIDGLCSECRSRYQQQITTEETPIYLDVLSTSDSSDTDDSSDDPMKELDRCLGNDSDSDDTIAEPVLFLIGKDELYGFNTKHTQKDLSNVLYNLLPKQNFNSICGLDVHRVYNTGGTPTGSNVYISHLQSLPKSTLRVLISYMGAETWKLRVNVQRYAETAYQAGAIDLAVLVFHKTNKGVTVSSNPKTTLLPHIHGTKSGIITLLRNIIETDTNYVKVGLADDDDRNNCPSAQKTFRPSDIVTLIDKIKGHNLKAWEKEPEELEEVRASIVSYIHSFDST